MRRASDYEAGVEPFPGLPKAESLSHGYPTSNLVEHDTGALYGVLHITQAVIQLRLLCEAGLPSGYPLADLLMKDRTSVALMNQTVADWAGARREDRGICLTRSTLNTVDTPGRGAELAGAETGWRRTSFHTKCLATAARVARVDS